MEVTTLTKKKKVNKNINQSNIIQNNAKEKFNNPLQNLNNILILHENIILFFQKLFKSYKNFELDIKQELENIKQIYNQYLLESIPQIKEYNQLLTEKIVIVFQQTKSTPNTPENVNQDNLIKKKVNIIYNYIATVKKYMFSNELPNNLIKDNWLTIKYNYDLLNKIIITDFKHILDEINVQKLKEGHLNCDNIIVDININNNNFFTNNNNNNKKKIERVFDENTDFDIDNNFCDNCQQHKTLLIDGTLQTCIQCGKEQEIINNVSHNKDILLRFNIYCKYTYDRQNHFKDCVRKFQGKQPIDSTILKALEEQFKLHDLVDYSDPDNIYKKVTKEHILIFLKEGNFSKNYDDINYIYSFFTGNQVKDISHLESVLLDDFNMLTKLYDEKYYGKANKNKQSNRRKNFIHTNYVLYQLLKRHNVTCDKNNFNLLKTTERQIYHDDIIHEFFDHLNWKYTPVL